MKIRYLLAFVGAACLLGGSVLAQMTPPKHHGLFGHRPTLMGHTMMQGNIIGNKRTHVYHMPGDNHLPEPKNRVYFRSEAEAIRAGYHRAGAGNGMHHTMMGNHMHGMKGGKMSGHMPHRP